MRAILFPAVLVLAAAAPAEQPTKPAITAEQVIEKSIAATGGREAMHKLTSSYAKGIMDFPAAEAHGIIERYSKAPNKQLTVTYLEGVGESRQGFDGRVAWSQDATGQVTELTGAASRTSNVARPSIPLSTGATSTARPSWPEKGQWATARPWW